MTSRIAGQPQDVGDLFSPFFRVAFRTYTKEQGTIESENDLETFQTTGIAGSGSALNSQDTPDTASDSLVLDSRNLPFYVASLSIEAVTGAAMRFSLTLTPPYEDAVRLLQNPLIAPFSLVKVQWGYTSNIGSNNVLSEIHLFRNEMPEADFGQDITITLSGMDVVSATGARNTSKQSYSRESYPTDFSIVQAILKKTNIELDTSLVDPTSTFFQTSNSPPTVEQHVTDWQFLRRLLADNNLTGSAQGSTFKVYSLNQLGTEPASYRFLWRTAPSTKRDIPMITFKGNLYPAMFQPPEARGVRAIAADPDSGTATASDITAVNLTDQQNIGDQSDNADGNQTDAAKSLASADEDDGEADQDEELDAAIIARPAPRPDVDVGIVHSRPSGIENGEERAKQIARGAAFFSNGAASLTAPGMPDVFPPMLVQVDGTSPLFDGPYTIQSVKHELSTDGYEMSLELMRHSARGLPGAIPKGKPVDPPEDDPDVEPVDEDADEGED